MGVLFCSGVLACDPSLLLAGSRRGLGGGLGLEGRLIETGESSASIGRFHLSSGDVLVATVLALVARTVETSHVGVEGTLEGLCKSSLVAGGDGVGERDGGSLSVLIVGKLRR